ncbi:CBS domain-containing protein [Halobacillus litoralis]|uniref:CBS domain-containing protein n=1 Tax=Halobacillus litoralis TaxID=45668 RepID=A0A845DPB1_9BACI|nr:MULTISPECIES: CBS domain-containing protein [Halobacillus]MYL19451.1 CBS domain-containing protein [Halobacillus litoralis]MYL28597.1 CBS domain-containing protein [Halobacillus halophilus]MYL37972.1 CBS domain-containing protein [Halobacillus litoralis]
MFVKTIMKPVHQSYTADVNSSLKEVLELLDQKNIEAVPVLDGSIFKGMISKEMIYESFYKNSDQQGAEAFLQDTSAGETAGYEDFCITNEEVFERTLPMFKGFAVLAVVDDNRVFQGLVTRYDVIEQFESAFGVKKQGIRIAFTSEESEGRIERLGDIIKNYHENVISLATFDETDKLARRIVLKIEENDNIEAFTKKLEKTGFRILSVKHV